MLLIPPYGGEVQLNCKWVLTLHVPTSSTTDGNSSRCKIRGVTVTCQDGIWFLVSAVVTLYRNLSEKQDLPTIKWKTSVSRH